MAWETIKKGSKRTGWWGKIGERGKDLALTFSLSCDGDEWPFDPNLRWLKIERGTGDQLGRFKLSPGEEGDHKVAIYKACTRLIRLPWNESLPMDTMAREPWAWEQLPGGPVILTIPEAWAQHRDEIIKMEAEKEDPETD